MGTRVPISMTDVTESNLINMASSFCCPKVFSLTSQAKLASRAGNWQWVDVIIDELCKHYCNEEMSPEEEIQILATSMLSQRCDALNTMYAARSNLPFILNFEVGLQRSSSPPCCFEITATSATKCVIGIHPSLNTLDWAEVAAVRLFLMMPLIHSYMIEIGSSSGSFVFDMADHGSPPAFAFSGTEIWNLIADAVFVQSRGYAVERLHFENNHVSWSQRRNTLLWRGSTTGVAEDWRDLPRAKLCQWAQRTRHRDLADIHLSGIVQRNPRDVEEIKRSGLMGDFVSPLNFNRYKYQIDIDGNTNSWPGLFIKMMTGSVVLKVDSEYGYKQWYYDELKPWENFVPVKSDLSDLDEALEWLLTHETKAKQIGEAAAQLARAMSYENELARSVRKIQTLGK